MSFQPPPPQQPPQPPGAPYPASAYQSYGGTGYGYAPTASSAQSLKGFALALTVLFPIAAVSALASAGAAFNRASIVSDLTHHLFSSDVQDADNAVGGTVGVFSVTFVAIAIVFMIWQYRHAKNAELLSGKLPLGPGWAIGGWFIPLANYVVPELQLYRSVAASDPDAPAGVAGRVPGILVGWWVLYGAAGVLFLVGRAMHPAENSTASLRSRADQFANADRAMGIGLLLMAAAAIVALFMVRQVTARQALAFERRGPRTPYQQPYAQQPYQQPYAQQPYAQPYPQQPYGQPVPPQYPQPPPPQYPQPPWPPAPS